MKNGLAFIGLEGNGKYKINTFHNQIVKELLSSMLSGHLKPLTVFLLLKEISRFIILSLTLHFYNYYKSALIK